MAKTPLLGSERFAYPGAKHIGPAPDAERLSVTLVLRRQDEAGFQHHLATTCTSAPPAHLSRQDYALRFGALDDDMTAVRQLAQTEGLSMERADACQRTITLSGTVLQFNKLFDVALQHYQAEAAHTARFRGRIGSIHLPEALQKRVIAVLGLDDRPQAQAHRYLREARGAHDIAPTPNEATARPPVKPAFGRPQLRAYTPVELAGLYDFPSGNGAGQCIGIIELGGGYSTSDLHSYFAGLGIAMPKIVAVSVDGTKNAPTDDPDGPDGEVMLDIEIAGAIAPQASLAVYFAPNTDAGFLNALNTAIHDTVHQPSVISLSWGGPEPRWTTQALDALNDVLKGAAAIGVTVCVASGDSGSGDGVGDGANHVDFPASSPFALGCGGTRLTSNANAITAETVWNDGANGGAGGGGVSAHFALPEWQSDLTVTSGVGGAVKLTKRGVPDVAGNADPESGYQILVHGEQTVVGGTSAVAPLWAGLIARINGTRSTPLGYLNPRLYSTPNVCRDISTGNNGAFRATTGWDACTGIGSPDGKRIASLT